jgi:hypothetical protein
MYLVGHAIVAFLIAFVISKKFNVAVAGVSFALVMLIASLPDVDILFQSAGITSHKTYTHSLIISLIVVPPIIFGIAKWRRVSHPAAFIYSLAYLQHIIIGDITVGAINVLYPFGDMIVGTRIGYGTITHQVSELLLLALVAGIVVGKSFGRKEESALFRCNITDKVAYVLLIGGLVISFAYLLYGVKVLPRLFIETNLELALFAMIHLSAIALVSFLALVSWQHAIYQVHQRVRGSQE